MKTLNIKEIFNKVILNNKDYKTVYDVCNDFIHQDLEIDSLSLIELQDETIDVGKGFKVQMLIVEQDNVLYGGEVTFYANSGYKLDDEIFKEVVSKEFTKTIYNYAENNS